MNRALTNESVGCEVPDVAGVAQLVERQPSKLNVASSNLVARFASAYIAQSVEHFLGKEEVTSSSLVVGCRADESRAVAPIGRAAVSKTACWGFESLLP